MIRVILPAHLRAHANIDREVQLEVSAPVTQRSILDALESRYPMLRGTMRDHVTQLRRPLVRFFACEEDISHDSPDAPLPDAVSTGAEPFFIIGAIAGGSGNRQEISHAEPQRRREENTFDFILCASASLRETLQFDFESSRKTIECCQIPFLHLKSASCGNG